MNRLGQFGLATAGAGVGAGGAALLRVGVPNPWLRFGLTLGTALLGGWLIPGTYFRAGLSGTLGVSAAVDLLHGFKRAPYEQAPRDVFDPVEG